MSEFIDSLIAELEEIYSIFGGSVARDKEFSLLNAIKKSEEALQANIKIYGKDDDIYELNLMREALAAIDALGKEKQAVMKIGDPCPNCNKPTTEGTFISDWTKLGGPCSPGFQRIPACVPCRTIWRLLEGEQI